MTLSILIWLPLAIALVGAIVPRPLVGRFVAGASLVTLGIAISFLARFKLGHSGLQFVTDKVWISALGIHYKLGLDGLNVALVVLTTILFSAALMCASFREWDRPRVFYFHFGLAESAVLGAFCAQDLALFVAFFDLMLIPFYFLIGMWGTGDRVRATTKLVIYTLVGSFFMLAAAIATGVLAPRSTTPPELRLLGAPAPAAVARLAGVDLPVLRGRVPGEDAARPVPRLARRRLQGDADPGGRGVLGDPLEGRGLRLPADRAAAVPVCLDSTTRR